MLCPHCGASNADDNQFCEQCGLPLPPIVEPQALPPPAPAAAAPSPARGRRQPMSAGTELPGSSSHSSPRSPFRSSSALSRSCWGSSIIRKETREEGSRSSSGSSATSSALSSVSSSSPDIDAMQPGSTSPFRRCQQVWSTIIPIHPSSLLVIPVHDPRAPIL